MLLVSHDDTSASKEIAWKNMDDMSCTALVSHEESEALNALARLNISLIVVTAPVFHDPMP